MWSTTVRLAASRVRILSKLDFKNVVIPANFDYSLSSVGVRGGSIAAIGPGKDKFHSAIFYRDIAWSELREHAKGAKGFHLWGQVTYEDIFKIERHTYFSFMIFVPTNRRNQIIWLATERHNYYD